MLPSGVLLKLLNFWGGAQLPPPLFESKQVANLVTFAVGWGILWNRLLAKLELVSPSRSVPQLPSSPIRGQLAAFIPSLFHDDESASEEDCSSDSGDERNPSAQTFPTSPLHRPLLPAQSHRRHRPEASQVPVYQSHEKTGKKIEILFIP